jgi:hypothetical protein
MRPHQRIHVDAMPVEYRAPGDYRQHKAVDRCESRVKSGCAGHEFMIELKDMPASVSEEVRAAGGNKEAGRDVRQSLCRNP